MELNKEFVFEGSCLGKSILIAEDEEINYLFLDELLRASKAIVFWAQNGQEAVDIMLQHPEIDLILMDIKMPKLSGYEATRIIKENNSTVKIIATTAYAFIEDKEKALSVGCDSYVSKPINVKVLVNEIRKALF